LEADNLYYCEYISTVVYFHPDPYIIFVCMYLGGAVNTNSNWNWSYHKALQLVSSSMLVYLSSKKATTKLIYPNILHMLHPSARDEERGKRKTLVTEVCCDTWQIKIY